MSATRAKTNGSMAATARSGIKTTYCPAVSSCRIRPAANSGGANYGKLMSPNAPACTSSTPFNNQPLACDRAIRSELRADVQCERLAPIECLPGRLPLSHGSYANYNSLQVSWQKQSGPVVFLTNYTFSKVLGIRDGQTDNGAGNGTVTIHSVSGTTMVRWRTTTPTSLTFPLHGTCPSSFMGTGHSRAR